MKTKAQTDIEILASASIDNNLISEIRTRHSESTHPVDCSCDYCKRTRFNKESTNEVLKELDWDLT